MNASPPQAPAPSCRDLQSLRFEVTADAAGRVCVKSAQPAAPKKKERGRPVAFGKSGSVRVPIYGRGGRRAGPFTIAWRENAGGARKRTMRADLADAQDLADEIARRLANGEVAMLQFGEDDRASYLRSSQLALPTGKALEVLVGEAAEALGILKGTMTLAEACRTAMEHRPAGVTPKNIPDLVTLLLEQKRKGGIGARALRTLEQQLDLFAGKFTGPLHLVRAPEINAWLRGLDVGLRTRKNYRTAVIQLARFARANRHVARTWEEMAEIEKVKLLPTEAFVWTPEQMVRLLAHCHANLIPLVTLMAFGGVRHEEMCPEADDDALLDWSNISLEDGEIRIPKTVAKTKRMRLIEMQPNLVAWLRPHAKKSGRICELSNTSNALHRLGKRAGIRWVKNACRNSFCTYRLAQSNNLGLVAKEAGNSPKVIQEEYLGLARKKQGEAWFAIRPAEQQNIIDLELFRWGTSQAAPGA